MRLVHALLPCPVLAAIAVACADAPQTIVGGVPQFDAHFDLPETSHEGGDGEAGCTPTDAGDATWASLYAKLFGPAPALGQCGASSRSDSSGSSSCHHDSGGSGAMSSGFICGDTQESCYQGITSPGANFAGALLVVPCSADGSYLTKIMRHNAGGIMPFYPTNAVFSDGQMAQVAAWINAGAPDN